MKYNNVDEIKLENKRRNELLHAPYDPISGEGCNSCERREVSIDGKVFNLPLPLLSEPFIKKLCQYGSYRKMSKAVGEAENTLRKAFVKLRRFHDFEYWAATCWYIKPKVVDDKTPPLVPLICNRGQRRLLKEVYDDIYAGRPIRINVLKARQWGCSTLIEALFGWFQLERHKAWNSVICAHVETIARLIRGMYSKALRAYTPIDVSSRYELRPYEGSTKIRQIEERNCRISIGSSEKPEGLRGEDVSLLHLSEVTSYVSTEEKKPEDLMQSLISGVLYLPETAIFRETTGKGVGNYFHREWQRSERGESRYRNVFVPWYAIESYSLPINDYDAFIKSLTPYDLELFAQGATLEQLNWYKQKLAEADDKWRFMSEFPSTANEAFQSTGSRYFEKQFCDELRKTCKSPDFIGELYGESEYDELVCTNMRLVQNHNGNLKIWEKPDNAIVATNHYCVVVDVNRGTTSNADNGIIVVFDRYWMSDGGVPEVVAEWCGHPDLRYLSWKAVQIAEYYQHAHLVIESNTPESMKRGGEVESALDEIAPYYDNLYCHHTAATIRQGLPPKWGFYTGHSEKLLVCSNMRKTLANRGYVERCTQAVDEFDTFEVKSNGALGAVEGCHDDRVMTRCIGVWVCQKLEPLQINNQTYTQNIPINQIINEATI